MTALYLVSALLFSSPGVPDTINVHEWGVVLYSSGSTTAVGSVEYDPYMEICVDAPVLFFHGAAFTGDVTVASPGEIIHPYPEPDAATEGPGGLGTMVRWEGLDVGTDAVEDRPTPDSQDGLLLPGYGWAAHLWRIPGASWVHRSRDGFQDRFLYYEVDMTGVGFPVPLAGPDSEAVPDSELFRGEALEFQRDPYGTVACVQDIPVIDVLTASDESGIYVDGDRAAATGVVPEAIRTWAGDLLTGEELQALWSTWEPYVLYGDWSGDRLLVFPIPEALVERISLIVVQPDGDLPVTYHRFFLGMVSVDGSEV